MSIYEMLGGDSSVKNLVHTFYEIMNTDPKVKRLRDMHTDDLNLIEEKLYMFMSGWLGGPQLYMEKFGHPRLRSRHLPFSIGKEERDQWMYCMTLALEKHGIEKKLGKETYEKLWKAIYDLADFMQNK